MSISPIDWPVLASGDRSPIRKKTLTLLADQLPTIDEAIRAAKRAGAKDSGEAVLRMARAYLDGQR